jgi:integrase
MDGQTKLGTFLKEWLETVMRDNIRQTSYMAYRNYIYNHINVLLGEKRLTDLKPDMIQSFIRNLRTEPKNLAGKTTRSIVIMLRSALDCAIDYEYIVKNPCRKIKLPKIEEIEVTAVGIEEQRKIERTILDSDDKRYIGILAGLYSGLRIGEICGLKWVDLDLESGRLSVKKSIKRVLNYDERLPKSSVLEEEPKTPKSRRTIPMPEFLRNILLKRKSQSNSEYVVSMKNGKHVEPRTMQFIYARMMKEAGVPYAKFHCLRHVFVTRSLELGTDIKTISEVLGHANASITANIYAHSLMEQKEKMMDKLNGLFLTNQPVKF